MTFQEQLDQFEMEKNALLDQNHNAEKEMSKLSQQYAQLLGHQNQKQKIQHVIKLKSENLKYREVTMLLNLYLIFKFIQGYSLSFRCIF